MTMRNKFGKRALFLATIVAMFGASAGFVLAAGLTMTPVVQTATWYQVSNQAVAAFPTQPTVQATTIGGVVATCTSTAQALTSGGVVNIYLAASSGIICTTGHFAEEFTLTSLATAAAGSYPMSTFDSYGPIPTTGSASATVTISAPLASSGTVNIFVDFGTVVPPAGGIGELDLIVQ